MGSPDVIRGLWDTQHSRRMVLLKIFQVAVDKDPSLLEPLPPIDDAWRMLKRFKATSPSRFFFLLGHPQVGSWLAYVVRRHRGGARSDAPWYVDFGQIHALALAAAALTGESYSTRVPLRDGRIMVPCFGMARFSGCAAWDVAEAEAVDGQVRIRYAGREVSSQDGESEGWWPLRRVKVGADPMLEVWLDDLDPLRDLADPVEPARLSDAVAARWVELLHEAWAILSSDHRELAESLAMGVTSLVPLPNGDGWDTRSASSGDAFGAVMCSLPPDGVTLAVSLAHEFAHIRLGGLMHLLPITNDSGEDKALYAPWRDDPRPLGGLIQGVYAFVSIAAFWRKHRHSVTDDEARTLADFEYAYAREQAEEGLANARSASGLTEFGSEFLATLTAEVDSWQDDPLEGEPVRLARLVASGHRIGWRLRHCRPSDEDISSVVSAWQHMDSGPVPVGPPETLADPAMRHWSQGRLGLARRRLQAPMRSGDALTESWGKTLTDADLTLFAGDAPMAAKGFAEQIASGTRAEAAADAWAGLALSLGADPADPGGVALSRRPELVQAVYRRVAEQAGSHTSPLEVARWIGSAVTG